jgi:hypothetical protein
VKESRSISVPIGRLNRPRGELQTRIGDLWSQLETLSPFNLATNKPFSLSLVASSGAKVPLMTYEDTSGGKKAKRRTSQSQQKTDSSSTLVQIKRPTVIDRQNW